MDQTLLFVLVIAAVLAILTAAFFADKKRREAMAGLAQKLNLQFVPSGIALGNAPNTSIFSYGDPPDPAPDGVEFVDSFPLFNKGRSRRIEPLIVGTDEFGTEWFLFDYKYHVKLRRRAYYARRFTVVVVKTKSHMPALSLMKKGIKASGSKLFGQEHIKVDSAAFDHRYFIKTPSKKMATEVLHPMAIEVLLGQPNFEWHMAGPYVMIFQSGKKKIEALEEIRACIAAFIDQIPDEYHQEDAVGKKLRLMPL